MIVIDSETGLADPKHEETFRVIDRRLFNAEGEIREEVLREEKQKPAAEPEIVASKNAAPPAGSGIPATAPPAAGPEAPPAVPSSRGFEMLVNFVAQNAAMLLGAYRLRPRRDDLVRLAWILFGLFWAEAVLGGISVKVRLAWVSVTGHFLLAITLIAVALVMHHRAGRANVIRRPAMIGHAPSYTFLLSSSCVKPSCRSALTKLPDCETPRPMTHETCVATGFGVPLSSCFAFLKNEAMSRNAAKPIPST